MSSGVGSHTVRRVNRSLCVLWCLGALNVFAQAAPEPRPAAPAAVVGHAAEVVPAGADEGPSTVGPLPVAAPPAREEDPISEDPTDPSVGLSGGAPFDEEPESLAGTLLRTLLVLGMVLGLVYVSLNYGLRKLMGVRATPLGGGARGLVTVVERIPVDPRRSLFVVRAAGEYLLVGGAEGGMNLISKLNPEEVQKLLAEQQKPQSASASPFLMKLLSRKDRS